MDSVGKEDVLISSVALYRVREVTRMTMLASAPVAPAPAQGGEWTRGFGVLGNRVSNNDEAESRFFAASGSNRVRSRHH